MAPSSTTYERRTTSITHNRTRLVISAANIGITTPAVMASPPTRTEPGGTGANGAMYDALADFIGLDDIQNGPSVAHDRLEGGDTAEEQDAAYDAPTDYAELDDVRDDPIITEGELIEAETSRKHGTITPPPTQMDHQHPGTMEKPVSKGATQFITLSYLIFFSLLGTLARVGLTALTIYPGAPVIFSTLWANVGGSIIIGFLSEDRKLFRHELGVSTIDQKLARAKKKDDEEGGLGLEEEVVDLVEAKKAHMAMKKTIPLYIGLATGFCGSFTSFSSFIRDGFLAMSNNMVVPGEGHPKSRNGGYSFMALLAVLIATISLSLSGLIFGTHLAEACEWFTPSISSKFMRKVLDLLAVVVGWGCWIGAVLMAIFPPREVWRGQVVFSLIFAPLGCIARFYLAIGLNGKLPKFPLGTFAANVLGTAVLGMGWDIAHVPLGGVIGCQVLQGIEDGFCGCLTTVSTWVAELSSLRKRNAYIYGAASVVVSLAVMIAIMGGLAWSDGFGVLACVP